MTFLKTFIKIVLMPLVALLSFAGYSVPQTQAPTLGSFNPTGGKTYRLQSSLSSTANSLTLSSFKEPVSNIPYTMSYLNSSIEYGTLEPTNDTTKEFVSFSGITQNGDGTATLTGLTRGLGFSYPYTASSTLQQPHPGQSVFVLSNPPQLTNQYANKNNSENIYGVWTFGSTTPPKYDVVPSFGASSGTWFVPYQTLINTAFQGAATSTEGTLGIVQLTQNSSLGTGTASSTAGAPLVLLNRQATTTPSVVCSSINCIVAATAGKISQSFLDLTQSYIWTGQHTFNATTSIAASGTTTAPLKLNGVAYAFPVAYSSASSTMLLNDGRGNLSWNPSGMSEIASTTVTTAASSITLSFPVRNMLKFYIQTQTLAINTATMFRFNADSGSNYSQTTSINGAADVASTSIASFAFHPNNDSAGYFTVMDMNNVTGFHKTPIWHSVQNDQAAGAAPGRIEGFGNWVNNGQATSITIFAGGGQTIPVGTVIDVYGSPL